MQRDAKVDAFWDKWKDENRVGELAQEPLKDGSVKWTATHFNPYVECESVQAKGESHKEFAQRFHTELKEAVSERRRRDKASEDPFAKLQMEAAMGKRGRRARRAAN